MAKSTKHIESLGPYDTFTAPWETEGGSDAEIDKPKLKRLIYNLKSDYAKSRDSHEDTKATLAEVETERDEAKTQAADANGAEAQKTIDKLTAENTKLKEEAAARKAADEHEALRKEVIGDLDPKYAKYVVGEDREALEKSLEDVKADFGLAEGNGDEEEEEEEPTVRTTPRSRLKNNADPAASKTGSEEYDFDSVADDILGSGPFG